MIPVLNPQEDYLTCVESACTHLDGVEECGLWEGDAAGLLVLHGLTMYVAPSKVTLRSLTGEWLRTRRDVREITLRGYRTVLDPICAHLGDRHVQSLTRDDVEALVEWMASRTPARSRAKGPR